MRFTFIVTTLRVGNTPALDYWKEAVKRATCLPTVWYSKTIIMHTKYFRVFVYWIGHLNFITLFKGKGVLDSGAMDYVRLSGQRKLMDLRRSSDSWMWDCGNNCLKLNRLIMSVTSELSRIGGFAGLLSTWLVAVLGEFVSRVR